MFLQKISIIYVWEGSDYAPLAASFSRIVNKTTYEDTEAKVHKNFVNFIGKTCVGVYFTERCRHWGLQLYHKQTLQHRWFPVKSTFFFTDHIWLLHLETRNSKNPFKDFSAISLTHEQQICDHFQLSKWKTNLKMHSLTKTLFP